MQGQDDFDIMCSECKTETKSWQAIDVWALIDKKFYCYNCQQLLKLGYFEVKKRK